MVFALTTYSDNSAVKNALTSLPYYGQTTNTPRALQVTTNQCFSASNGDRPNVENLALIVTDGVPYPDNRRQPAIEDAKALKAKATMIAVGVTDVIDEAFLKELSSPPHQLNVNYVTAANFKALEAVSDAVVSGTCKSINGK